SIDAVEMGARGDFRHHPAIGRVLGKLRVDQIGADMRSRMVANHRRRGLVAARLNPENDHQTEMARLRLVRKRPSPGQDIDREASGEDWDQVGSTAASYVFSVLSVAASISSSLTA